MQPHAIRLDAGQFFGDIDRHLDVDDLLLRETRHGAGQVIPGHVHEHAHFCLGIAGSCRERIGHRDVHCVPGTVEYHPAGTMHSSRWDTSGGRCFTLTIGDEWLSRVVGDHRDTRPRAGVLGPAARGLMARLHRELLVPDECSAMAIDGLALALLAVAARGQATVARRAPPRWLSRAEEYLHAHAFGQVRAAAAAQAAGVNPVQLSRWFGRVHGMSIGEFVRRLRLDRACHLLVTSSLTLTEIALACGFTDHSHLTRTFRRTMHVTPSEFRRLRSRCAGISAWASSRSASRGVR